MTSRHDNAITREQLTALQALYSRWAGHTQDGIGNARAERLRWASEATGRAIQSFSELTRDEARGLIDSLKGSMGQPLNEKPDPWRPITSRERSAAAGTAGRRRSKSSLIQMAGPDDFARIDEALIRLGWPRDRYEAWLNSQRSPLAGRSSTTLHTVAEVNRVWWALKSMLKRSGRWIPGTGSAAKRSSSAAR